MAAPANNPSSLSVGGISIPSAVPATVTAVLTIVFMFLPWVNIPLANMANTAMAFTGNGLNISPDYTILSLNDLINTLLAITPNSADAEREIAPLRAYIFFWGASIVVLIAGVVVNFMGKKWLIIVGSVLTAIAGIVWCGIIMSAQNEIGQGANGMQILALPPWPYAAILASVGTIILAAVLQPSGTPSVVQPGTTRPPQSDTPSPDTVDSSCYCPNCGALVQVAVPNSHCLVNITCGGCGERFPMEVRPRS